MLEQWGFVQIVHLSSQSQCCVRLSWGPGMASTTVYPSLAGMWLVSDCQFVTESLPVFGVVQSYMLSFQQCGSRKLFMKSALRPIRTHTCSLCQNRQVLKQLCPLHGWCSHLFLFADIPLHFSGCAGPSNFLRQCCNGIIRVMQLLMSFERFFFL